ncbi:MAG: ACP S-malonyltransferase [Candidatus Tectomicrobia bacterium]|uniref:ACP S-malonyltransferase n=1 Tax=Tectimicrobiota bacterium TaxID=2528274 RepID=A0A932G1N6_UNCTE|nr:ACP S-malonyltransferase [Candidatus Tectomicrobia bacterium]
MPAIMADHDIEGHLQVLLRVLTSTDWRELWDELDVNIASFESLSIPYTTPDLELWRICQAHQIVLITGNRNAAGPNSLEGAILRFNDSSSLPVLTIGDPLRILSSCDYAQRVATRLLEYLVDLENIRGTGRLYLP